jgi:antitoxin component YwqK of YwqJK toxin-antitoxin module
MKKNIVNKNNKGQLHGIQIGYYDTGKIGYKDNYINGKKHGEQVCYHDNGQVMCKENYINGEKVSKEEWIAYERKLKMKKISNL